MQVRFLASLIIFIGSYLPLSLILLAQDINYHILWSFRRQCYAESFLFGVLKNPIFSLLTIVLCLFCFILSLVALKVIKPSTPIRLKEINYIPAELMNYTLPYVVAFMKIDYQATGEYLGLFIFLAWVFMITHRSGQVILNPLLIVFGWRHYEVTYQFVDDKTDYKCRGLSREKLKPGDHYLQSLFQDIMVIAPKHEESMNNDCHRNTT